MEKTKNKYSLIIIGAGPAGLTASIYASRYKIDHIVVGEALGGLAFEAHKICNFITEEEISGPELINKMQKHVKSLGASILMDKIIGIDKIDNNEFRITTQSNKEFFAKTIILAVGTKRRKMNLPNEGKYIGKGVSYCATCDAMFYKNKTVAVVGGGNSANTASLYLAEIANKVYQIYRRDKLRGETTWIEKIKNNKKIEVLYNTKVINLKGEEKLEEVVLDIPYKGKKEITVDGLFVEIGTIPQRVLVDSLSLDVNEKRYIKVSADQKTSEKGIWAAGDITTSSNNFNQIITACSEGAIAADSIFKFFQDSK